MFAVDLLLVVSLSAIPVRTQQHEHQHEAGRPAEQLGRVEFETSCDVAVRADFNRGVALLHSFWFGAAADQFTRVAERDPSCAMAWWGVAMSRWGNPFAPSRPVRALEEGRAASAKALAAAPRTNRERLYVGAASELFKDFESVPHRTRIVTYERAMQQLYEAYPQDREAAAFYALAVNQTARPDDKSYAQQLRAAAILEVLFEEQPDHPGAAHYLIHAYDHPPLAERALPAARRYAKVAPDAPHALHMPSHTFTRVGLWEDSIATNRASAEAARRAKSPGEVLHALDYQVYAYLQIAQDRAARGVLDELQAITASLNSNEQYGQAGLFAAAAMPARYALERGEWTEAARLQPRVTPFPYIDAMTHFARAIGAARSGNAAAAREDAAKLAELHAALAKPEDEYWAQQVEIQHTSALGWAAFAGGRPEEAVQLLRKAAELEGATDKAAITPGPLAPARELLGDLLLELDRPAEALIELEAVLKTEPNRFRALYGAARAASLSGSTEKAAGYYAQLVEMCAAADTPARPELERARQARASAAR